MRLLLVVMFLASCAVRSVAPPALPTRQLAGDTTVTTRSGASFTAPRGWWLTRSGDLVVVEDPDRTLTTYWVETSERDGRAAIAAAWQRARPGFARTPAPSGPPGPPEGGWEAITYVEYQTPVAEHRVVAALARRHAGVTYVALLDGDQAALGRRGAQLGTMLDTLRPQGLRDESLVGQRPRAIDPARLDAFIEDARRQLGVPGAAVAIVHGHQVVYERGFGVRSLDEPDPVTPDTRFLLGSVTKQMTTMMQAALVDAGTLRWDTPVTQLLPSFALGDRDLTRKLVLWHMSCACTGMPKQNLETLFEFAEMTPEQRIASMRSMKPTTRFGETYQYSNLMVTAGGFAAAHASDPRRRLGDAYDAAMQRTVFTPIGMRSTTFDFAEVEAGDHAVPHAATIDGEATPLPLELEHMVTPIRPAGGAWSTVRDLARYAMTELADGVAPDGKRVVSVTNLRERRRVRVRASGTDGYGLGLNVGSYRGLPVLEHAGGTFGFRTLLFMLPEPQIAVIILTNTTSAGGDFVGVVQRAIIESLFAGALDLARAQLAHAVEARRAAVAQNLATLDRTPDAKWLQALAGTYHHPALGRVTIRNGGIDAGEWRSAIAQRREPDGTLKIVLVDPPLAGGEIIVGGDPARPVLIVLDGQQEVVLTRDH